MPAFGYVRKSVMADDDKTLSPLVQVERIRALAASRGDDDLVVLSDLGISGAKVEERPDYKRLVAAIESGEATSPSRRPKAGPSSRPTSGRGVRRRASSGSASTVPACAPCKQSKGQRTPDEWLAQETLIRFVQREAA